MTWEVMSSGSLLTVAGYFFEHQGYHTVSDYFLQPLGHLLIAYES